MNMSVLKETIFPITAKLNPFGGKGNLSYLWASAIVTRLGMGAARIIMDYPALNPKPYLPDRDKYGTFFERINIELFGTIGYMVAMHLGQDLTRLPFELATDKYSPKVFLDELKQKFPKVGNDVLESAVDKWLGMKKEGLFKRFIFDSSTHNLHSVQEFLTEKGLGHLWEQGLGEAFIKQRQKLTVPAAAVILSGLAASMLFGGYVVQRFNDKVAGPKIIPWLGKVFGIPMDKEEANQANKAIATVDPTITADSKPIAELSTQATTPKPALPESITPVETTPAQVSPSTMAKPMQAPLFSPAQISVGEETLPPGLLMNAISQVPNIAAALAMNPAPYPQAFPGTMPAAGRASSFLPRPSIPVTVYPTITVRL